VKEEKHFEEKLKVSTETIAIQCNVAESTATKKTNK